VYYTRRHPKRKQVLLALLKAKTRTEVEAVINTWYADASPAECTHCPPFQS
jgi:hypothetical protein